MKKIIFSIFVTLILISCTSRNPDVAKKEEIKEIVNTGALVENVEQDLVDLPLKASGLDKDLVDFNNLYKQALINSGQGNKEAITQIKTSVENWGNIISKYRGYNVDGFEKSTNLDEKLVTIGIDLLNSSDFATSGKMDLAHIELEKVRNEISIIRQENNIKSISDDMLIVHNKMEEIITDGVKKDTKKFDEIKIGIKKLNEYNTDNSDYKKMLGDFEKAIIDSNELSGDDYKTKLQELKSLFIKMYMKFG